LLPLVLIAIIGELGFASFLLVFSSTRSRREPLRTSGAGILHTVPPIPVFQLTVSALKEMTVVFAQRSDSLAWVVLFLCSAASGLRCFDAVG